MRKVSRVGSLAIASRSVQGSCSDRPADPSRVAVAQRPSIRANAGRTWTGHTRVQHESLSAVVRPEFEPAQTRRCRLRVLSPCGQPAHVAAAELVPSECAAARFGPSQKRPNVDRLPGWQLSLPLEP